MVRPFIALIACSLLAAACATSPRAVKGPAPSPTRRGDTTATQDTTKRDTSAIRDTGLVRLGAHRTLDDYLVAREAR
ncbi:MAG TPA: hypothetical protein VF166_13690 [Gemmatimonadaceae bacterium]